MPLKRLNLKMSAKKFLLNSELNVSLFKTSVARGLSAVGGFLLIAIIGKVYGPSGVGVFALAQSLYLGACIIGKFGMDHSMMRYVGMNPKSENVAVFLRWGLIFPLVLSLLLSIAIFYSREYLALFFSSPELDELMVGVCFGVPIFTLSFVISGFFKGVNRPVAACLMENGVVSFLIAILLFFSIWYWENVPIAAVGWFFAAGVSIVFFKGVYYLRGWFLNANLEAPPETVKIKDFGKTSVNYFLISISDLIQQVVLLMVAGWVLSNEELGLFRAAERIALLISFVLIVQNAIFPPRFSRLYYQGDYEELSKLSKYGASVGIILSLPFVILCFIYTEFVVSLVGEEFLESAMMLKIIVLAQFVNVSTGSVGFLLNMTGNEKLMRNISILCSLLGIVAMYTLASLMGALGAAIALSLMIVIQNVSSLFFARKKLGFWAMPFPNINIVFNKL